MTCTIELASREVEPGGTIEGNVRWDSARPSSVKIALWWETKGRGDRDKQRVQETIIPVDGQRMTRFVLTAPFAPFSFSGALISVIYTVTATLAPGGGEASTEVVIAPGGVEVVLAPA